MYLEVYENIVFIWFEKLHSIYPANTGKPIVAVLTNAPAKIRKGSNGYFSIMG